MPSIRAPRACGSTYVENKALRRFDIFGQRSHRQLTPYQKESRKRNLSTGGGLFPLSIHLPLGNRPAGYLFVVVVKLCALAVGKSRGSASAIPKAVPILRRGAKYS